VIKTDHVSLKHLLEQRLTHSLQHKSLSKLLGLDYSVQYKKGIENKAADALSRRPTEGLDSVAGDEMSAFTVTEIVPTWLKELKESYENDDWAAAILHDSTLSNPQGTDISVHAGIIRKEGRIYVGVSHDWRGKIVQTLHDSSIGIWGSFRHSGDLPKS
jgi:hypothetical protein